MMADYRPDALESFRQLVATGCVEILAEPYFHSLSYLYSPEEFERQVFLHMDRVDALLDIRPEFLRNTELIHDNQLATLVSGMGMKGLICEGVQRILNGRSPNRVYAAPGAGDFPILLRNVELSDDIAFRFGDERWNEHPLTAAKFAEWIHRHPAETETIQLLLDYETFGVHKRKDSGIFDLLAELPAAVMANPAWTFQTPSEIVTHLYPSGLYDVKRTISWDDKSRDNCVTCEDAKQNNSLNKIYSLAKKVRDSRDEELIHTWGVLQLADHFYYWNQNSGQDGCKYPNPFNTIEDAFSNYSNILTDFEIQLIRAELGKSKFQHFQRPFVLF
jgi:alpha-amylase